MTLETEIYTRLKDFSGMSSLVSTRIYPVVIPQNSSLPAVCFQRISSAPVSNFGSDPGAARTRVQVTIIAEKFAESTGAVPVRDLVVAALKRYRGGTIQDCFLDNEQHDFESEPRFYRIILDFFFWHGV